MTKLESLVDRLQKLEDLPGWKAQSEMASPMRRNYSYDEVSNIARRASVLILFYERDGEIVFPLNKRHTYRGVHSGQIGLPGGSLEPGETNAEAALRETEEELSIPQGDIKIIRPISEVFVPPSKFLVSPFLGFLEETPNIIKDDGEVKEVIEVNYLDLFKKSNIKKATVKVYGIPLRVPAFIIKGEVIWGATAMILSELTTLLKKE